MIISPETGFWNEAIQQPTERRHGAAPDDLVDALRAAHPGVTAAAAPAFEADLGAALRDLPAVVLARLHGSWLGAWVVEGLGREALTDLVVTADGGFLGLATVLDAGALANVTANSWASARAGAVHQATPAGPVPIIEVRAEDDAADTRANALRLLLLHEAGKAVAAGRRFIPDWWTGDAPGAQDEYAFLPLSWQVDGGGAVLPVNDAVRRAGADAAAAYAALGSTSYLTPHGAQSPLDDFAEAFALYGHCVLSDRPWTARVFGNSGGNSGSGSAAHTLSRFDYAPRWDEPRLAGKLALLKRFVPDVAHEPDPLVAAAALPFAPLVGTAPLMRRAFDKQDMTPVAQALLARAEADGLDANAYLDFAITLQLTGDRDVALDVQAEGVRIRPHYTLPSRQGELLRLLVIMGLGDLMANTPIEFLLEDSDVTLEMLYVTADAPWPEVVPEHDVMMVCMGENDTNQPLLARLSEWIAGWPRPVVNSPERIAVLSRDGVCNALAGIDGVEMPQTVRLSREQLAALAAAPGILPSLLPDGVFPLIVRPLGSHAGHDLDKIDTPADLAAYLARVPAERFYLSRFVDYRGANGLFGKYRVVLVDGRPYLAHFASSGHWMVHYLNAGMAESEAKRALEAEAMAHFDGTFALRHRAALAAIDGRIGLPYVGMDCAETPDGRLLVFEVDNAMIVHAMDDPAIYPYKKPAMQKIFTAFRQMLENARSPR
jgi:glutathione synthase/RimK-type ligase-like ATP-grasp enzyme